jgi:signal transduction histidine kinase
MHPNYREIQEGLTGYVYVGTVIFLLLAGLFVFFLIISLERRKKLKGEQEKMKTEFQQTLLQSQLEIQEQTLHNLSQEIHDNIGQVLSLAKLYIGTIDIYQPETALEKINDSRDLVGKAIQDLRNLARSMNTGHITELGLLRSIEYELELIGKSGALIPQFNVQGQPVKIDAQKELILFRIFQELINNIIKHAGAKKVDIRIVFTGEMLNITVTDNGKGFDATQPDHPGNPKSGLGLRNMKSRAQLIGADLSISSIPGTGTTTHIRMPIAPLNL